MSGLALVSIGSSRGILNSLAGAKPFAAKTYFSTAHATPSSSLPCHSTLPFAASMTLRELPFIATAVPTSANSSASFSPSPSANTFFGSTLTRFNKRSTAAPLETPSGKNSSIPATAVVITQSFSNIASASSRRRAKSVSTQKSKILLIPVSTFVMSPTGSGVGSPYASTLSVSALRLSHRIRVPQNATAVTALRFANRNTLCATTAFSSMDSTTAPSASQVTQPCTNTPGMGGFSLPRTFLAHGPRDLPVANTVGTPEAAARASAASTRMVSSCLELSRVPSTSVTMSLTSCVVVFPLVGSLSFTPCVVVTTDVEGELVPLFRDPFRDTASDSSAVAAASFASTVFFTRLEVPLLPPRLCPAPKPDGGMRSIWPAASLVGRDRARLTTGSSPGTGSRRAPLFRARSRGDDVAEMTFHPTGATATARIAGACFARVPRGVRPGDTHEGSARSRAKRTARVRLRPWDAPKGFLLERFEKVARPFSQTAPFRRSANEKRSELLSS